MHAEVFDDLAPDMIVYIIFMLVRLHLTKQKRFPGVPSSRDTLVGRAAR